MVYMGDPKAHCECSNTKQTRWAIQAAVCHEVCFGCFTNAHGLPLSVALGLIVSIHIGVRKKAAWLLMELPFLS